MSVTAHLRPAQLRHDAARVAYRFGTLAGRPRRENFLRQMPRRAVGAEVGVFRGEYSREILRITRPRELHLIDAWWELYGDTFPDWGSYTDYGRLPTRQAYDETMEIVARYGKNTGCEVHVGNDIEILSRFPDGYFDWVYLDSGHLYEETLAELGVLVRKVRPGGVIGGDDFAEDPADINHGCAVAIREFCRREGWRLGSVDAFRQWTISPG